ncbi:MAG: hypothetical protein R3B47_06265 [Bacteroidia bacterium]
MLAATLPRVIGPGETAMVTGERFCHEENVKSVKVSLETSGLLSAGDSREQTLNFAETGEKMAWVRSECRVLVPERSG